jgi:hypothetical protein
MKDAIRKEFNLDDDRLIQAQIDLMQTEQKIRIESKVKIWIKQLRDNSPLLRTNEDDKLFW